MLQYMITMTIVNVLIVNSFKYVFHRRSSEVIPADVLNDGPI